MTEPIVPSTTAMIASATSASIKVKPAASEQLLRDNLDASGQPVDAHLIAHARARQRDDPAARHPRRKEIDRPPRRAIGTARGQHRLHYHVARQADCPTGD